MLRIFLYFITLEVLISRNSPENVRLHLELAYGFARIGAPEGKNGKFLVDRSTYGLPIVDLHSASVIYARFSVPEAMQNLQMMSQRRWSCRSQNTETRFKFFIALAVICCIASAFLYVNPFAYRDMRMGSGPKGGTMIRCSKLIQEILQQAIPRIRVHIDGTAEGTFDNLRLLKATREKNHSYVDLAIITEGVSPNISPTPPIGTIARLYINALHVLALDSLDVDDLSALVSMLDSGRLEKCAIALPPRQTASSVRSKVVLLHYGLAENKKKEDGTFEFGVADDYKDTVEFRWASADFYNVTEMLLQKKVKLAFYGGGIPVTSIPKPAPGLKKVEATSEQVNVHFVEIDLASGIEKRHPPLFAFKLPKGTYGGRPVFPKREIQTLASYCSLVGRRDLSEYFGRRTVYSMTEAVIAAKGILASHISSLAGLTENFAQTSPEYPLLWDARRFYDRKGIVNWNSISIAATTAGGIGSLIVALLNTVAWAQLKKRIAPTKPQSRARSKKGGA